MNEAARLLVIGLIATIGTLPIVNSRHELTVRHVRCAEHGELTHVQSSQGVSVERAKAFSSVQAFASVQNEETDKVDGHDHCTSDFLVRGRLVVSVIRSLVRYTAPPAVAREISETAAVTPGRAFVLASAPKTSPPSV